MKPLLEVQNLSAVFHTVDGDVNAVTDLSYSLDAGESLAIVGESGCGKSVGALALMSLVPASGEVTGGRVLFDGIDLGKLSEAGLRSLRGRDIAMVFQDPMTSLNPVLNVGYQLSEPLRVHGRVSRAAARQRVVETLELVGIPNATARLADYPHQFSGGQRQRIMIAMAIICQPRLLIADEPTTALDVTIQAQIVELIGELQKRLGMAVIWITHDLALVADIVERIAVMYAGSIVEHGPVGRIFSAARHPYTRALLRAMPRFERPSRERLESIDGAPPDLALKFGGCAFAPRCPMVVERCRSERPSLQATGDGRVAACWRASELQ